MTEHADKTKSYPCFVVYTGSRRKSEFYDWLEEEGFERKSTYGGGAPWVHVYLYERLYQPGKIGVGFGYSIGNHAISIDDYKVIYDIYKKYEGLNFMDIIGDPRLTALQVIAHAYSCGHFEHIYPMLADDCVWESQWRLDPEVGKEAVMKYFDAKGAAIRESRAYPRCEIVKLIGNMNPINADAVLPSGEKSQGKVGLYYEDGKLCLFMGQTIDDKENGVILDVKLNEENLISRIDLCMPELFRFEPYEE